MKIPESISAIYYMLDKGKWLWQLIMVSVGLLLLPIMLSITPDECMFLAFLSCAGIIYVGASPLFKIKPQNIIHYISAIICCVSAILWCVSLGGLLSVIISAIIVLWFTSVYPKSIILWLELATLIDVLLCLKHYLL